jgi:hypothetical protein
MQARSLKPQDDAFPARAVSPGAVDQYHIVGLDWFGRLCCRIRGYERRGQQADHRQRTSFQSIHPSAPAGHSKGERSLQDNFFTVELIDAAGERVEYTVYFKLSRAPGKGRLNLYVQSAYVQDDTPQERPRPRKPIRFSVVAYNVAVGKVIRVPK